ncbi:hypothetical protein GGR77_001561 [Xanthomonas translucens]
MHIVRNATHTLMPVHQDGEKQHCHTASLLGRFASPAATFLTRETKRCNDGCDRSDSRGPSGGLCTPKFRHAHDTDSSRSAECGGDRGQRYATRSICFRKKCHTEPGLRTISDLGTKVPVGDQSRRWIMHASPLCSEALDHALSLLLRRVPRIRLRRVLGRSSIGWDDVHRSSPERHRAFVGHEVRGNHQGPTIHIQRACHA